MAGFATKLKDVLLLPTGSSSWKGHPAVRANGAAARPWAPQEPVGPAFSQLPPVLTAALSPCPSPTLQVIHLSSPCPHQLPMPPSGWGSPLSPYPCPHLAEAGGNCSCSPGQLLEQSPEGWPCVCTPGMTELAAVGGPGPHCPHGNLPKKRSFTTYQLGDLLPEPQMLLTCKMGKNICSEV